MIWDAILDRIGDFMDDLAGQIPLPPWVVARLPDKVQEALAMGAATSEWIDWGSIGIVLPAVIAMWVLHITLKVLRLVLSLLSGGGGNA